MASLDDLLAGFGRAMLGQPLKLDAGGVCELGFHEGLRLTIEPEPGSDRVHLYSRLAPLPTRNAETVYGKLLTANLFGKGTGEAAFAIDPMQEAILLNRVIDAARLDTEAFGEILTGFMDTVEHWSRELDGPDFAEAMTKEPAAPAAGAAEHSLFIVRG